MKTEDIGNAVIEAALILILSPVFVGACIYAGVMYLVDKIRQ